MNIVAVVGLGYVGLPLAVEFGKKHRTIGYDLSPTRSITIKNISTRPEKSQPRNFGHQSTSRLPLTQQNYRWPTILLLLSQRRWTSRISPISGRLLAPVKRSENI